MFDRNDHPALTYSESLYAAEDQLLTDIRARLEAENFAWQIGATEGKLLQLLIGLHGVKTIVEIGTLAGYSTIWMARALPDDGHITTLNRDAHHIDMAKEFFGRCEVADKITMFQGDAHQTLTTLTDAYDMVFIDAEKPGYNAYLDWAEKHIRPGGLIVADNVFLNASVWQSQPPEGTAPSTWAGMRRFNERLSDTEKFFTCLIPTAEGLSVAVKLL